MSVTQGKKGRSPQLVGDIGGGGQDRTAHLGVMKNIPAAACDAF